MLLHTIARDLAGLGSLAEVCGAMPRLAETPLAIAVADAVYVTTADGRQVPLALVRKERVADTGPKVVSIPAKTSQ